MTREQFQALTPEQRKGMFKVWQREARGEGAKRDWLKFREEAEAPCGKLTPYVGIHFCGMFLGIEPDGYTHS